MVDDPMVSNDSNNDIVVNNYKIMMIREAWRIKIKIKKEKRKKKTLYQSAFNLSHQCRMSDGRDFKLLNLSFIFTWFFFFRFFSYMRAE